MKKHLVSYGNIEFSLSNERIREEARKINIFDSINIYSELDLPPFITNSVLFSEKRGGGYWIWKPYVILKKLAEIDDDDLIVYSDSGNELFQSTDWDEFFSFMNDKDGLFFEYDEATNYGWNDYDENYSDSPKLKHWTKKNTISFFQEYFKNENEWLEKPKIMAGFFIIKKSMKIQKFINDWLNTMIYHPKLVVDNFHYQNKNENIYFSEHRHDQSILSILIRIYMKEKYCDILLLNEYFEFNHNNQPVKTSRKREKKKERKSFFSSLKRFMK